MAGFVVDEIPHGLIVKTLERRIPEDESHDTNGDGGESDNGALFVAPYIFQGEPDDESHKFPLTFPC